MNSRSAIFTVILVLLVPLGYSSFATNEACAAPREEGWGTKECKLIHDGERKACCWHETTGDLVCQICDVDGTNCDPPIVDQESKGKLPSDLQDSLDVNPTPPQKPKVPRGDILPDDGEPTINDPPITTSDDTVVPRKGVGNPEYGDATAPLNNDTKPLKELGDSQDEDDEDDGPTINDPSTTTEPKILDPGKIEIPNLK
jgi:hypothetical protein